MVLVYIKNVILGIITIVTTVLIKDFVWMVNAYVSSIQDWIVNVNKDVKAVGMVYAIVANLTMNLKTTHVWAKFN